MLKGKCVLPSLSGNIAAPKPPFTEDTLKVKEAWEWRKAGLLKLASGYVWS